MRYIIQTYKDENDVFAEIIDSSGKNVCTGDGTTDLEAIKEVCLVFADIIEDFGK